MPFFARLSLALLCSAAACASADEGMFSASQIPQLGQVLKDAGYRLDPQKLADLNNGPLKAVVRAGGGTGAFVSAHGLLLTNHHVANGVIQYNTTAQRNLIDQGFVADSLSAELPANPDFRVLVTSAFERVTEEVLRASKGLRGRAYFDAVDRSSKAIIAACERQPATRCAVATMDYGLEFYRVEQLELRDIRLVYAPPRAIGNFGDEIDNFVWPRHSGDFTLLRAYVGRDGKPADFDARNVPFKSPIHLKAATVGPRDGDFVMLAGYPGITHRQRFAEEFINRIQWGLPHTEAVNRELIDIVQARGGENPAAAVAYAAQLASLKNGLKRASGERLGLLRSGAIAQRQAIEIEFSDWLEKQPARAQLPKGHLADVKALLAAGFAVRERDALVGLISSQTQLLRAAISLNRLALERLKPDTEREAQFQVRDETLLRAQLEQVSRRFDARTEVDLLTALLTRYQRLPDAQRSLQFDQAFSRDPKILQTRLTAIYAETRLGDLDYRLSLFRADPQTLAGQKDPLLKLALDLQPALLAIEGQRKTRDGDSLRLRPAYMQALSAWNAKLNRPMFSDANQTLRLSYGHVTGLKARDAVSLAPVTTVAGILEKHTGQHPYNTPPELLAAIQKGDFADTQDPTLGTQTVNFLTNLDSTGGNSGSPVLNADGELIGLNFDSNWEAVSASWLFDPRYKRAIHVDLRYIRWLMQKVYPAAWLLEEMAE